MKIQNKEIGIKIGDKKRTFKNLIMNSYLNLFADSFLEFKNKNLPYCLINFNKDNSAIDENSTAMNYDTVLEMELEDSIEILTGNSIINKYLYKNPVNGDLPLEHFVGQSIRQIGFADFDNTTNDYILYAYLDISKYNITIQDKQPVIISRIDKITSDMNFWTKFDKIKGPYHLTKRGLLELHDMEYETIIPKLYSVGFGILPYLFKDEYLAENLTIQRGSIGEIKINEVFSNYQKNELYPREDLYPSETLYPKETTANLLIYKFKMYKVIYPDPSSDDYILEDTGMYYMQYKELERYGKMNLAIKYERG